MGATQLHLPSLTLPLITPYRKKDGKTHFLTGHFAPNGVRLADGQNSHLLKSFAEADLIVEIPASPSELKPGDRVQTWVLPK